MSLYRVVLENSTNKVELKPSDELVYLFLNSSLISNGDGSGTTDWLNPDSITHIAQYWGIPPSSP